MLTVYLDQKDWIGLAKASYRSDATEDEQVVATSLQAFADADLVRFPVAEMHLVEATRIGKQEQRLKLASVFARFGRSWFLAGRQTRLPYEIEWALAQVFGVSRLQAAPKERGKRSHRHRAENFVKRSGTLADFRDVILSTGIAHLRQNVTTPDK